MMMDNPDTWVEIVPLGKSQVDKSETFQWPTSFHVPFNLPVSYSSDDGRGACSLTVPHSSTQLQFTRTQLLLHLHHYSRSHPAFTSFDSTHQYRSSPTIHPHLRDDGPYTRSRTPSPWLNPFHEPSSPYSRPIYRHNSPNSTTVHSQLPLPLPFPSILPANPSFPVPFGILV